MRRILVEQARRKDRVRHGGGHTRVDLDAVAAAVPDDDLVALSEAEDKVSDALAAPVADARDHVADQPIKHSDATGWRQGGQARRGLDGITGSRKYTFVARKIWTWRVTMLFISAP